MPESGPRGRVLRMGAEFLVIVIGVLVALAVDEWSTSVGNRELEEDYLRSLAVDLRIDSTAYAETLAPNVEEALAALATIVPIARGVEPLPSDTVGLLRLVFESSFSVTQFEEQRTTYEELLTTGNLSLVRSAGLRTSIVAYYEQLRLSTNRSERSQSGYAQLLRAYLPLSSDELDDPGTRTIVLGDLAELAQSEELLRAANQHRLWLSFQLREITRLQGLLHTLQADLARAVP